MYLPFVNQLQLSSKSKSDQQVLISITVNITFGSLPDRIDQQVSKSVLEKINRGDISRNEAIEQIQIREY